MSGFAKNGIKRWLGIPYARAERFGAPQKIPFGGDEDGLQFAPQCPQLFGTKPRRFSITGSGYGEDCLALNIYAPDTPPAGEDALRGRPVYVFIHGGAFISGSSNPYDGSWLAQTGDMVVVTINYRVGILGFVNFGEALGLPDIPSNIGLRDQIAALEWVRDHIGHFGGDPARVTIGGQSAGSMSVSLLMHSPQARGLFRAAVLQSGAVNLIHDHATSVRVARRYAELLDVDQGSLARLRDMDITRLFEAQAEVQKETPNGLPAAPWYDGDLLPASLEEARAQPAAPVPIIAGSTSEETRLFEWIGRGILPMERGEVTGIITRALGADRAAQIVAAYPDSKQGNRCLASDFAFLMPTRNFAHRHSAGEQVWVYRFDYAHPLVGAAHGIDLTIAWPFHGLKMAVARGGPFSGRRKALGERMNAHLAHFVRHLRPMDDWPRYTPDRRELRIFDLEDRIEPDANGTRFAVWQGQDVPARIG